MSQPIKQRKKKIHVRSKKKSKMIEIAGSAALTAYTFYCLIGSTFRDPKNKETIDSNFDKMQKNIEKNYLKFNFNLSKSEIKLLYNPRPLGREKNLKCARNIYENICINKQLFAKFRQIFSRMDNKQQLIDLDNMIGLKTFESKHVHCIQCENELERKSRDGGSICISYGQLEGAQVGISYRKKCKECNITYLYGQYETESDVIYERLQGLDYFELSPYTYIKKDMFTILKFKLFESANAFENYVNEYNLTHVDSMDVQEERLECLQQTLGRRVNQTIPLLLPNRIREAFYIYTLRETVECKVKIRMMKITKHAMDMVLKKKKERILLARKLNKLISDSESMSESTSQSISQSISETTSQSISESETLSTLKISFSNTDLFEFWYREYIDEINIIDSEILNFVPVKNGEIMPFHFICMMDGNSKNIRDICGYSEEDQLQGIYIYIYINLI